MKMILLNNKQNTENDIKVQCFFIRHILNYTGYNQKWNVKTLGWVYDDTIFHFVCIVPAIS